MKFLTNKYPLVCGRDRENNKPRLIEVGTAFTISAIEFDCFYLAPVQKQNDEISADLKLCPLRISAALVQVGFNEAEFAQ